VARKKSPGGTPATVALTRAGISFTLHEYAHDPRAESFGLEAAQALGLDPARVFKTLMATVDTRLAVAVVPVSGQLDLKALARALGASRAAMAERAAAERTTGYVAGGISHRPEAPSPHCPGRFRARPSHHLRLRRPARARPRALPRRPRPGHRRGDRSGGTARRRLTRRRPRRTPAAVSWPPNGRRKRWLTHRRPCTETAGRPGRDAPAVPVRSVVPSVALSWW